MLRPISRLSTRSATHNSLKSGQRHQRRCINFAPPSKKPRSLKNKFARLGLAGGAVYWFANSDIPLFSKQDAHEHGYIGTEIYDVPEEAKLPTLEAIAESRRRKQTATASIAPTHTDRVTAPSQSSISQNTLAREAAPSPAAPIASTPVSSSTPTDGAPSPATPIASTPASSPTASDDAPSPATPIASTPSSSPTASDDAPSPAAELEDEAASEGAFNEETGEINWDCPCLGGMAHGPCGDEFRTAFSCFVYSKEEPKGVDCIERFKGMQDCFRAHPDIYGAELTDDDMDEDTEAALQDAAASDAAPIANAPYSGASTTADAVPEQNLTATPEASPASMPANQTSPDVNGGASTGTKLADVRSADGDGGIADEAGRNERAKSAAKQVRDDFGERKEAERSESSGVIPKAAIDTRSMNEGK